MAKKTHRGEKTAAVKEYMNAHPEAMPVEIAAALTKQGITITPGHVSAIKGKLKKAGNGKKATKPAPVVISAPAAVEKPSTTSGGTITLDQVKMVAHTIKSLGGTQRVEEVLEVIKEMGGVKKFRDLVEAMSVTAFTTDAVPY
jgi:hypothetical protein